MKLITHTLEVKRHIIDLNNEGITIPEDILNIYKDREFGVRDLPELLENHSMLDISKNTIDIFMKNYPKGTKDNTITLRDWILETFILTENEEIDLEQPSKYEIIGQDNFNRFIELSNHEKDKILKC